MELFRCIFSFLTRMITICSLDKNTLHSKFIDLCTRYLQNIKIKFFIEICQKIAKELLKTQYEDTALELLKITISETQVIDSDLASSRIIAHLLENNLANAIEEYRKMQRIIISDPYNWALVSGLLMLHGADTKEDFYKARNALLHSHPYYQIVLKCLKEGQCDVENCIKVWNHYLSKCDVTDHIVCAASVLMAIVMEKECSKLLRAAKSRNAFKKYVNEKLGTNHAHNLFRETEEDLELEITLASSELVEIIRLIAEGHMDKAKIIAEHKQVTSMRNRTLWARLAKSLSKENTSKHIDDTKRILAKLALLSLP